MIDFIKLAVFDTSLIERIRRKRGLEFYSQNRWKNKSEPVIKSKTVKQYKGIVFYFYKNKLEIHFKPHYYFNDNLHNANDFTAMDCIGVFRELIQAFSIEDTTALKVINLEYGLNLLSPMDCQELLLYLSYHGTNKFYNDMELLHSKKSYEPALKGKANTYKIIKAYAKGEQYPAYCDPDTFRFEIKSKQARYLNEKGIYSLTDLLNKSTYKTLAGELLKEFREILILDNRPWIYETGLFTVEVSNSLHKYSNPFFWNNLLKAKNQNGFTSHKQNYFQILEQTRGNIHVELEKVVLDKLGLLLREPDQPNNEDKNNEYTDCSITGKCPVTGIDISMQKQTSRLLSDSGLRYYRQTNPELFEQIKNKYLPQKWKSSGLETQIKRIAISISNSYNNSRKKGKPDKKNK